MHFDLHGFSHRLSLVMAGGRGGIFYHQIGFMINSLVKANWMQGKMNTTVSRQVSLISKK